MDVNRRIFICSSVDTDYFRSLRRCLETIGMEPGVVASITEAEYRSASKKSGFRKRLLRLKMYLWYPMKLLFIGCSVDRRSLFIVTSNTFYAPLLVSLIGKVRGFRTVHLLYDLFPDALEVSGGVTLGGKASRLMGWLISKTQRVCDASVYLGDLLRRHSVARWGGSRIESVIDIGADEGLFKGHRPSKTSPSVVFHYGGQLGYMHDAETLVECIAGVLQSEIAREFDVQFHFSISGARAEYLRSTLNDPRVTVETVVSANEWRDKIRAFHVGLVSLSPGGASVCLPSKTYSMMGGGLAILAVAPLWSDLAALVMKNKAGWVINNSPHDCEESLRCSNYLERVREHRPIADVAEEFRNVVREICLRPEEVFRRRTNAWNAIREKYGVGASGDKWADVLRLLTNEYEVCVKQPGEPVIRH